MTWLLVVAAVSLPLFAEVAGAGSLPQFVRGTRTPTPTATPLPATPTSALFAAAEAAAPPVAAAAAGPVLRVPADVANLQTAISQVPDGGIIELAAGTYASPSGGFTILNAGKSFTIRAASGANVVIDGGGSRDLLRLMNTSVAAGRPITFERLVFANGRSTTEGVAGGISIQRARATFIDCTFQNNRSDAPSTGGGGLSVAIDSEVFFFDCRWEGNIARNYGGGMAIQANSRVVVHRGEFVDNRTNAPNHSPVAGGGAIHVGNATLWVTNSRFTGNEAGYAGGAVYVIGNWLDPVSTPRAELLIANSTFIDNHARRDPSVSFAVPTEAGAVHIEDQARGRIYNSRFRFNSAHTGGGVNTYRAILEIEHSVFEGNRATGTGPGNGFGGAIMALSSDANDATTNGGAINRRPASLTVRDTLIRGRVGAVTTVAQIAGGIYTTGDVNRAFGLNGVAAMGSVESNRASVTLERVAIVDCDVQQAVGATGSGVAGGLMAALTTLSLTDSILIDNDAIGTNNGSGGGAVVLEHSNATIARTMFARNSATHYGGGLFVQGSAISVDASTFAWNEVSPGVAEAVGSSYGAAIFTSPSDARGLPVSGTVANSVLTDNIGLPIFDDDRAGGPINDVRYNGNQIYSTTFGSTVYTDSIAGQCCKTVAQLNALVVPRTNGTSTAKSQVDNVALASPPIRGALLAVPSLLLSTGAAGDDGPPAAPALVYAWSGGAATLNGAPVTGNAGLAAAPGTGTHTLAVGAMSFTDTVELGAVPAATLAAAPPVIEQGQPSTLSWTTPAGTFLGVAIDQGAAPAQSAAGSTAVQPSASTTYRLLSATREGGATAEATVDVGGAPPAITAFSASPVIVNPGSSATLTWTTTNATSVRLNGTTVAASGSRSAAPGTWTLVASNAFGEATAVVTVNANSGTATLAQPTITAPAAGQTLIVSGVSFAWSPVSGAAGYDVRILHGSSGAVVFSGSLAGNGATTTLVTLPQNGPYVFAVRACTAAGFGDAQCSRFATRAFTVALAAPTAAPTVVGPTAGATLTATVQTLSWTRVTGSAGLPVFYEVELEHLTSSATALRLLLPDPTSSTITKLRSGTYQLRVRACEVACGPWSAPVQFTATIAPVPSQAPSVISATVDAANSLTTSWSAIAGAEWYQVFVVQQGAGPGGGALTVAAREVYNATSLTLPVPAGAADVIVAACTGNGCGPFSGGRPVVPAGPNPAAPQLGQPLAGSTVTGPLVLFTWSRIPGDTGSNTVYRLFVQDLSRQGTAFDVFTTQNFYAAYLKAEGARYDALVIANPGPAQIVSPAVGFVVTGTSSPAPSMVQPPHNGSVRAGNVQLGWSPVPGATLYEYYVAVPGAPQGSARGVTPGLVVQVPLTAVNGQPTLYSGIVRACPAGAICQPGGSSGWGPWSNAAGPGVTNFTVTP